MKMNSPNEKAVQAIIYGHGCTMQLKELLDNPMGDDGSVSSHDLANTIVRCFSNAISVLSAEPYSEADPLSDTVSRKSSPSHLQRSPSKKRKINSTNESEKRTHDSSDPIYDQYLWRKYGEKYIKKSGHQRSYYRCSYHNDHNCKARKHEEKIKEYPPVYRTTYFGRHICKINHNKGANFSAVGDPAVHDSKSSRIIQFRKDIDKKKESHSSGTSLSVKYEEDKIKKESIGQFHEITGNDQDCQHVIEANQLSSSSGSYLPPSSSSGSESIGFDSEMLLDNQDSWDRYDQLYFGLR